MSFHRRLAQIAPLRFAVHLIVHPRQTIGEIVRRIRQDGVLHSPEELFMASLEPRAIWEEVLARYSPKTLLDVGCGVGRTIDFFVSHGVDAQGIEASELAIRHANHPDRILRLDLQVGPYRHPNAPFDLVWSYEVAEHIHAKFADTFVETLTCSGSRILMSSARPGQGGVGHLNEQPPNYWQDRMALRGFELDEEATRAFQELPEEWARNVQVFRRTQSVEDSEGK
jgi:SAM-dependent methyltransferase